MDARVKRQPEEIRQARRDNPTMRERDIALQLGISEAELVAAEVGVSAIRIEPRVGDLLTGLEPLGEVMALTRNDSAVHEKIGVYDKVVPGSQTAMVLGAEIDLRIFPGLWAHGFAVEKRDGDAIRRSLQFFDAAGEAVHKIHLRPASDVSAYDRLVATLEAADQSPSIDIRHDLPASDPFAGDDTVVLDELRTRWSKLTDTHQFFGMLKALKVGRLPAVRKVGSDYAWKAGRDAVAQMLNRAAEAQFPIMCFVGNRGCIQIHSGPITTVRPMGPWINVMDPTFHLHLRLDHIAETWVVRKPTKDGHVTSVEAYGQDGSMIIQFFGKRHEGVDERADWRALAEDLPRADVDVLEGVE